MDIYGLRKIIRVVNFVNHVNGCGIHYIKDKFTYYITLTKIELFNELVAIGTYDDTPLDVDEFEDYVMSQWDALNIALRKELTKEAELDLDKSDIGKAIENLKNK